MTEQQIADLTETINRLNSKFNCLQASQEAHAIEIASKLTVEAVKSAKKFQVLDLRLNDRAIEKPERKTTRQIGPK